MAGPAREFSRPVLVVVATGRVPTVRTYAGTENSA
jgi:hypothetical protein